MAALYATAATARRIHDEVDAEAPTIADILDTILERLEQLARMIDAERRVAKYSIAGLARATLGYGLVAL